MNRRRQKALVQQLKAIPSQNDGRIHITYTIDGDTVEVSWLGSDDSLLIGQASTLKRFGFGYYHNGKRGLAWLYYGQLFLHFLDDGGYRVTIDWTKQLQMMVVT